MKQLSDLTAVLESVGIGHDVNLTVWRQGRTVPMQIEVADVGSR